MLFFFKQLHDKDDDNSSNLESNWFSFDNSMRLYNQYVKLDENQNGMLCKSELAKYALKNKFVQSQQNL